MFTDGDANASMCILKMLVFLKSEINDKKCVYVVTFSLIQLNY